MIKSFKVRANTPIGIKDGVISFAIEGESLSGTIECMGEKVHFSKGKIQDNSFEFSGIIKKFFYKIPYTAKGLINNTNLKATAITKYGNITIDGIET